MKIVDLMTTRIETISQNATAKEAARKMHDLHVGSLAVEESGKLVGIITDRDICCKVTATGRDAVMTKVKEVMTKELTTCFEDQDVEVAAHLMSDHHIRRLAVLHDDKSMAGFITVDDLARGSHDLAASVLEAVAPVHH